MAEIKTVNGRPTIDYMARDYDSILQAMRALIPEKLPEWTDLRSPRRTSATCCCSFSRTWGTFSATTRIASPTRASWDRPDSGAA